AGFAVHTVRWIQADALAVRRSGIIEHLVNISRAEVLARTAVFADAPRLANVRVVDDQVRGLILFMLRAGMVEVSEFVECQLAITLCVTEKMGFRAAIR